jgi:ribosomal protein L4
VVLPGEDVVAKSFRNLEKTLVLEVAELEVTVLVWARSVLLTEGALSRVQEVAR